MVCNIQNIIGRSKIGKNEPQSTSDKFLESCLKPSEKVNEEAVNFLISCQGFLLLFFDL